MRSRDIEFSILEQWIGTNPLTGVAADPLQVVDGSYSVPDGPGLGITIDEEMVRRLASL